MQHMPVKIRWNREIPSCEVVVLLWLSHVELTKKKCDPISAPPSIWVIEHTQIWICPPQKYKNKHVKVLISKYTYPTYQNVLAKDKSKDVPSQQKRSVLWLEWRAHYSLNSHHGWLWSSPCCTTSGWIINHGARRWCFAWPKVQLLLPERPCAVPSRGHLEHQERPSTPQEIL